MQDYVKSGISILNDVTKDLENLNGLGIYLSKQANIDALKTLKLMVLANETGRLDRKLDINSTMILKEKPNHIEYNQKENIIGNLSMNSHNFALEFFEYISKNYSIDYDFTCYGIYSILENWLRSFRLMHSYEEDMFYKRYDMVDKKMDIIEFSIRNGLLKQKQIEDIFHVYNFILESDNKFSKEQLQRIEKTLITMVPYYKLQKRISNSKDLTQKQKNKEHDIIDKNFNMHRKPNKELFKDVRENASKELEKYRMHNDQCAYILYEIPELIKTKTI